MINLIGAERKSTAKELTVKDYTEEVVSGNHKYTLIKEGGYNSFGFVGK